VTTPALAITLGTIAARHHLEAALAADSLGFDAVFVSDHLVLPDQMTGDLGHDGVPPVDTPLVDALGVLTYLAGRTTRVKLGTFVYVLGLRHPFVVARGFATLDHLSGGRALCGFGAGWLTSEFDAMGISPKRRGHRLVESIDICRRLWTEEDPVAHKGEFFEFEAVHFRPKPLTPQGPPVMLGGDSEVALRRAAEIGDGWLGRRYSPQSAADVVERLRTMRREAGREGPFEITVIGEVRDRADLAAYGDAGVDRVVVSPWARAGEAVPVMRELAEATGLTPAS